MPQFFPIFITIFIAIIVYTLITNINTKKHNEVPIKKFSLDGKKYLIYSKKPYNSHQNKYVTYELRTDNGMIVGTFNSLNDILVLLSLDAFPSEDIFS